MVLFTYCGLDPQKVMEESSDKCGLEAYRLLNRAYDGHRTDDDVSHLGHILQIGTWSVKGAKQADSMMREAKLRKDAWEKRSGKNISDDMMLVITV